jgi:hypothetical protein
LQYSKSIASPFGKLIDFCRVLDDCDKRIQCENGVAVDEDGLTCDIGVTDLQFDFLSLSCASPESAICFNGKSVSCEALPGYQRIPHSGWLLKFILEQRVVSKW